MAIELIDTDARRKTAVENIREHALHYFKDNGTKALVVGMSGGLDSTLVACLMRPVADKLGIPLVGEILPIDSNPEHTAMGVEAAELYCSSYIEHSTSGLSVVANSLVSYLKEADKVNIGNIKARMRMIVLYNSARRYKGLVLSTDNLSELLLGFWTLHGDVGDYSPIQYLFKGAEESQLARYLGIPDKFVDQIPTDGLGISESDVAQFGVESYEEVDRRLIRYIETGEHEEDCPIISRMKATEFKRNNPINVERHELGVAGFNQILIEA